MKKLVLALTLILIFALALTGCTKTETPASQAPASEAPVSEAPRTFTVGFDASFPPYGYTDESGNYVGFDLDLAAEVCARRGWELVLQPIDWDAKDMELESGAIDCIWNGFTKSEERLEQYTWTDSYVDNSQVFVVKADAGIQTQADLAGKSVCVQVASSALDALQAEESEALLDSFKELVQVADYQTAFLNLESGAVDAIAMDVGVAKYQIGTRGDEFVILDEALVAEEYAVGFKLGNDALRDEVQETLYEMAADGTLDTIAATWDLTDSVILGK